MIASIMALALMQGVSATPAKANDDSKQVVCRNELELGSRIARRVCRTKQEIEQMARDAQQDLRKSENQRHVAPN